MGRAELERPASGPTPGSQVPSLAKR
jgi:hypothetical protein